MSMLKVSEMKAEYFPPKEDVILQNEAPTDFYILVTGAVVSSESWRLKYLISMLVKQWKLIFFIIMQDLVVLKNGVEQASIL